MPINATINTGMKFVQSLSGKDVSFCISNYFHSTTNEKKTTDRNEILQLN